MNDRDDRILARLEAMHDTQLEALRRQEEHLALYRRHLADTERRLEESIALQRTAVKRQQQVGRIVLPLIAACIALIVYLLVRYF